MDFIFLFVFRKVSVSVILLFLLFLSGTADFLEAASLLGASSNLSEESDSYSKLSLFSILF
jgi:hypothetical protein